MIIHGDCLEVMKGMEDNSVDSIVTDPPYELGFMNKKWDNTGIAYNMEIWEECLRILKPGGYLLSFGGTRTYHRMACAIEDAGFEIRDQLQWIYGSGFPKGQDISKAIDDRAGRKRKVIGVNKNYREISGKKGFMGKSNFRHSEGMGKITAPASEESKKWDGWNTTLKPAHEPIVLARKPLSEKTIADNVLKWGTGGINIDDCRIELQEEGEDKRLGGKGTWKTEKMAKNVYKGGYSGEVVTSSKLGRFPANVIFDEEAGKLLDEQSGISKSTKRIGKRSSKQKGIMGYFKGQEQVEMGHNDSGGASRFFYCAKASKRERNIGLENCKYQYMAKPNIPENIIQEVFNILGDDVL